MTERARHWECPPTHSLPGSIGAAVPVLETARLHLRAPKLGDFPILLGIVNGPRGSGIGGPLGREDAWYDFAQMTATWIWRGHGWWTITDRASGEALGFVGIGFEPEDEEPELGYMLTDAAEGRGIATEAALAARDYGFNTLGLRSMVSYVNRANSRSIALATRLGAVEDTPANWDEPDTIVFRHPAAEGRS